ncbi:MAG TPA: galactokinase [Vicinamibacterales bacterium]|nr:galactokinase [Vicinamibacterales bacterium]
MSTDASAPSFADLFGRPPEVTASAPGRVNLIGEHTDYNEGFVMPVATPMRTDVEIARRADLQVHLWTAAQPHADAADVYELGRESRSERWSDYVKGVTLALQKAAKTIGGFEMRIVSNVPLGAGLSSSASLEVAVLKALNDAFGLELDPIAMARFGQAAETEFVGVPIGIMDQMAASLGTPGEPLFIDIRAMSYERLQVPRGAHVMVIDSGITHQHAGGGYLVRRQECRDAAQRLGVAALRDLDIDDLVTISLPPPLDRRVRHVVTENHRVLKMCEALRAGDLRRCGKLMNASHESMRDDFEISTPEIDELAAIARSEPAVVGARLTGGGFGGSVVVLGESRNPSETARAIARQYTERTGHTARALMP